MSSDELVMETGSMKNESFADEDQTSYCSKSYS
jgi:hypothetical protein